jgi:hypothetical protein
VKKELMLTVQRELRAKNTPKWRGEKEPKPSIKF